MISFHSFNFTVPNEGGPNNDFSRFLIGVINGSGVSLGQVANLLEFIPGHMAALPVYMCLDFQASYNFACQKTSCGRDFRKPPFVF